MGLGKFSGQAQKFLGQAKPAFLPPGYVAAITSTSSITVISGARTETESGFDEVLGKPQLSL